MRKFTQLTVTFYILLVASPGFIPRGHAQTLKKVRMGSSSTNVSFLAIYTALHRGFFKDKGIDLKIIQILANLTKDTNVNPETVQAVIDSQRQNAKVAKPVSVSDVVDFSFLDKARKELGITK